jgi:hypothetical protein
VPKFLDLKKTNFLKSSYFDKRFQQGCQNIARFSKIFYFALWPVAKFG